MDFEYAPGATPLDPDEAQGLIPSHIANQSDLNAWEEANIVDGATWASRQKKADLLTEGFVRNLHRHMFDKTWAWAGTFRSSNKNIGVDWTQVAVSLRDLLEDTRFQIEHNTYPIDELVIRFHHRLVWIHAFPNGNGRHARLMADTLAVHLGRPRFSWGAPTSGTLIASSTVRQNYLSALRAADKDDFTALFQFARAT
jgi:Fic-DOC domain mobile mystery protein B